MLTWPILALIAIEISVVVSVSLTGKVWGLSLTGLFDLGCLLMASIILFISIRDHLPKAGSD